MRGCFVTGTDTGVGKSVLSAAIVAALAARGEPVRALKPLLTGLDEPPDTDWPRDHELLAAIAGCDPGDVVLQTFGPPVSPHLAAELAGVALSVEAIAEQIAAVRSRGDPVVVEGVGGLLVPIGADGDVRTLAARVGLPVVIAARSGLGTINHTLLTLEAARRFELPVAGVVLTPWPEEPDAMLASNRATIERLGAVEVATLPHIAGPIPEQLAAAGAGLPLERWLA